MFRRLFLIELVAAMLTLPVAAVDIPVGTVASCNYETLHTYEDGASVQLRAVWEANKYTVTYDKGEHATNTGTAYTDTDGAVFDENYTIPDEALSSIVAAEGYTFVGFNTESGKTVANFPDAQTSPWKRTSNLTVYAAYTAHNVNIAYNCGSSTVAVAGTWTGATGADSVALQYNATYGHPIGRDVCQLAGYNFADWHCVDGTVPMITGGTTHETDGVIDDKWKWDVANVTCTAVWNPKSYNCGAGYYLDKSNGFVGCAACPKDSYCPGFENHTYSESDYGVEACPDGYVTEDKGNNKSYAKSEQECYKESSVECSENNPYTYGHGTAEYATTEISCRQYKDSSTCVLAEADRDACRIVRLACEPGYEQREIDGELRCVELAVECEEGTYLPSDSRECEVCPENNYCGGGRYEVLKPQAQGIVECGGTLKSPAGSQSENDCGVILHVDGDVVYLHRDKRKSPSLVVSINGTKWYADTTPIEEGAKPMSPDTERTWHVIYNNKEYTIHTPIYE